MSGNATLSNSIAWFPKARKCFMHSDGRTYECFPIIRISALGKFLITDLVPLTMHHLILSYVLGMGGIVGILTGVKRGTSGGGVWHDLQLQDTQRLVLFFSSSYFLFSWRYFSRFFFRRRSFFLDNSSMNFPNRIC